MADWQFYGQVMEGRLGSASWQMDDVALPFESHGVSHRGCVRALNEDNYLMEPRTGLWVVADGMGGHDAGEIASAAIVKHLASVGIAASAPDLRARFEDRLNKAHREIRVIARTRGATIGSTIAALLAMDGKFACLWSGDSRIYLVRGGAIQQVSRDHTEVQELVDSGRISAAEARHWPRRNVITRAIGVGEDIKLDFRQGDIVEGDVFVLGSDGLTAHVGDDEIAAAAALPPHAACEALLEKVLARGGTDNVTVIVVRMTGSPDRPLAMQGRAGRHKSALPAVEFE